MKEVHVYYSGTVQGVGFRYNVQRFASGLGLGGWVKNLPDGRVEILAEGEENKLNELLKRVDARFEGYIRDKQVHYQPADKKFDGFDIAY